MRKNIYSSKVATNAEVVKRGISRLLKECREGDFASGWIVSHAKSNLDGHLGEALGKQITEGFDAGRKVRVNSTIVLSYYGERTLPSRGDGSPILVCYPSEALLTRIDGLGNIPVLIVLPWDLEEVQTWIQAHGAEDLFGTPPTPKLLVANPVVARALESLWVLINKGTGIAHPSDKQTAIDIFKMLQAGKENYFPSEVRAWLVQKGMEPRHADDIAAIATKPSGFRSKAQSTIRKDRLEAWRKEVEEQD